MCSIAGSINHHPDSVTKMCGHMFRRGPDGYDQITHGNVTLGHTLLSIIGNQKQPIESERYILTYNGEWFNYKDYYPYETSDSMALSKSFEQYGIEQTLKNIIGQFAIGLYDKF